MNQSIIELEAGFDEVKNNGIDKYIELVESKGKTGLSAPEYIAVYDVIFKMCCQKEPHNWTVQLYARHGEAVLDYLNQFVKPALRKASQESNDNQYLATWNLRWQNNKVLVKGLTSLFMYLDRFHATAANDVVPLTDRSYKLFKDEVFNIYAPKAAAAILASINRERNSESQDRTLLHAATSSFMDMGFALKNNTAKGLDLYKEYIETPMIKDAGEYYARMSSMWLDQDSAPNYLLKADKMLASEKSRVDSYLNRSTAEPLLRQCYVELLQKHQVAIMEKKTGINNLLSTNAVDDLSRLYNLYNRYPEDLPRIGDFVHDHIDAAGSAIVAAAATSKDPNNLETGLVASLIRLHERYKNIIEECFQSSAVFARALKQAFETFINKDDRVSEFLANFVHEVLRKGSKLNLSNVDETLSNTVFLYGYIRDKDVFESHYQSFLSERLIKGLCNSEHSEKEMIAKLKKQSGYQWTNKLEGMFKDEQLSKELMGKFQKEEKVDGKIALDVKVCTTSYWPALKDNGRLREAKVPAELKDLTELYKNFYVRQFNGTHKLDWRFDDGTAEIKVIFSPSVSLSLVCTTYMMLIMLCFNNAPRNGVLTFKQILEMTGCQKNDIDSHLLSLCHPKCQVLKKNPNVNKVAEDHKFMINSKFKSQLKRVNVPLLKTKKEDDAERQEEARLQKLRRQHMIDAATVRIMKTRKTLRHQNLVADVVDQLKARFSPHPADIKKRIEALIEQEYLRRDDDDRSTYHYLAN